MVSPKHDRPSTKAFPLRLAVLLGLLAIAVLIFSVVDVRPSLRHLRGQLLSGPNSGAYHKLAGGLANAAKTQGGELKVLESKGSFENISRLANASTSCDVQFALTQDGIPAPKGVELLARLPRSESVFIIGLDAAKLTNFAQLKDKTVGVGPKGGGSDYLARQIFALPDLAKLGIRLQNGEPKTQLAQLGKGTLDLGLYVIDEDASFIHKVVTQGKLQLASFQHLDVIARRFPYLWHGRIGAGQFDAVKLIPAQDKRVLRVDTLVVGNGCASHAQTIALLSLLRARFPSLLEHQRRTGKATHIPLNRSAKDFFQAGGPDLADQHVPWLVDIMPPSSWAYVVMALSLLFNVMAFGNRFRLWRIDADRVKIERAVRNALGLRLTPEEILRLHPSERHHSPEVRATLDAALLSLSELRKRCRKQSISMLVPMGQEMAYRYQEDQIEELLSALRNFVERFDANGDEPSSDEPLNPE